MKIVFAPDSFKGSLTSQRAIELLTEVCGEVIPEAETLGVMIGDGGEGTMEAIADALNGEYKKVRLSMPVRLNEDGSYDEAAVGEGIYAQYLLAGDTALIEMASASGLTLVPEERRDPRYATSYGTGEVILDALKEGCTKLYLMIGGSATNDGGLGWASALGCRFLDKNGRQVIPAGCGLAETVSVDPSGMLEKLKGVSITVMCDVTNPLTGPEGATFIYGPQKGAVPEIRDELEAGMIHYADIIEASCGRQIRNLSGAGAAGGLAFPLLAYTDAELKSGISTVLELVDFEKKTEGADCVITGEGRIDHQSAEGKVLWGIGKSCMERGIPVYAIAGCLGDGAEEVYECGINGYVSCVGDGITVEMSMQDPERTFRMAAWKLLGSIR